MRVVSNCSSAIARSGRLSMDWDFRSRRARRFLRHTRHLRVPTAVASQRCRSCHAGRTMRRCARPRSGSRPGGNTPRSNGRLQTCRGLPDVCPTAATCDVCFQTAVVSTSASCVGLNLRRRRPPKQRNDAGPSESGVPLGCTQRFAGPTLPMGVRGIQSHVPFSPAFRVAAQAVWSKERLPRGLAGRATCFNAGMSGTTSLQRYTRRWRSIEG